LCIFFDSVAMSKSGSCIWVASPGICSGWEDVAWQHVVRIQLFLLCGDVQTQPCAKRLISFFCSSALLIRLKRIYNFWCSMLVFTPFA
jgi:hypothetical protein